MEIICESIEPPKNTMGITFSFFLFGLTSLLVWNSIVTEFEFFQTFIKLDPFSYFPFLNSFPNITLQFILLYKKDLFKLKKQLITGLIASIILIIVIPSAAIFLEKYDIFLNIIMIILILIMGLVNAILSSGFFAFSGFFPLEMIIAFSTGQGFSGIIMNIIKYIIIYTSKNINKKSGEIIGAMAVFGITEVILFICLLVLLSSIKNYYFDFFLNRLYDNEEIGRIIGKTDDEKDKEKDEEKDENNSERLIAKPQKMTFCEMFKLIVDIDLLCAFIYIITFAVYPVAFEGQKIFSKRVEIYNFNTILTIYNIFDTLGRYLVSKVTPTKKNTYISVLSRVVLIITILYNYYLQTHNKIITFSIILLIINDALLALTNGIGTTLCYGIAPNLVNNDLKGQAGASVSFFTVLGIFIGSIIAIFTKEVLKKIGENY